VIVLTGPTATGKTALSVLLAGRYNGEIVNGDAMQVYRGMDIGTAKPTLAERQGVPHHLFDVAEPGETYTVSRYVQDAVPVIAGILARGKTPVIVGGTLLYIDSLLSGREFADTDPALREQLSQLENPYAELAKLDPAGAAKLHPNDSRRVIRALEVCRLTGRTISEHNAYTKSLPPRYNAVKIALDFNDRATLYARIDKRVDTMIELGLTGEVRRLNINTQAIGYKEVAAALNGKYSMDAAVELVKKSSRNYAKRQLTWLRHDSTINWVKWDKEPNFEFGLQRSTEILIKEGYNVMEARP
jgi:tRNA dimethylallyltransferase